MLFENLIKMIDRRIGYCVICRIKERLDENLSAGLRDLHNFYSAKELIRRREYDYSKNPKYKRQYISSMIMSLELERKLK